MEYKDYYKTLGVGRDASADDLKKAFRKLARKYHPDINPDDNKAKDKFIALTEAYKLLLTVVLPEETAAYSNQVPTSGGRDDPKATHRQKTPVATATSEQPGKPKPPNLLEIEERLKWKTYEQLQRFLQEKRFPQAIALAEALADRLSTDAEVRQWLAIAYQIWGRALISENQLLKARIYLKKALKTDPHNKSLWYEVQRDFQRLEQIF